MTTTKTTTKRTPRPRREVTRAECVDFMLRAAAAATVRDIVAALPPLYANGADQDDVYDEKTAEDDTIVRTLTSRAVSANEKAAHVRTLVERAAPPEMRVVAVGWVTGEWVARFTFVDEKKAVSYALRTDALRPVITLRTVTFPSDALVPFLPEGPDWKREPHETSSEPAAIA